MLALRCFIASAMFLIPSAGFGQAVKPEAVRFDADLLHHFGSVRLLAFRTTNQNQVNRELVSVGEDRSVRLWDLAPENGLPRCTSVIFLPEVPLAAALHPNGRHLVVGYLKPHVDVIDLNNVNNDMKPTSLPLPDYARPRYVGGLVFSSNGNFLAVGLPSGVIRVFDFSNPAAARMAFDTSVPRHDDMSVEQKAAPVYTMAFHAKDDTKLVAAGHKQCFYFGSINPATKSVAWDQEFALSTWGKLRSEYAETKDVFKRSLPNGVEHEFSVAINNPKIDWTDDGLVVGCRFDLVDTTAIKQEDYTSCRARTVLAMFPNKRDDKMQVVGLLPAVQAGELPEMRIVNGVRWLSSKHILATYSYDNDDPVMPQLLEWIVRKPAVKPVGLPAAKPAGQPAYAGEWWDTGDARSWLPDRGKMRHGSMGLAVVPGINPNAKPDIAFGIAGTGEILVARGTGEKLQLPDKGMGLLATHLTWNNDTKTIRVHTTRRSQNDNNQPQDSKDRPTFIDVQHPDLWDACGLTTAASPIIENLRSDALVYWPGAAVTAITLPLTPNFKLFGSPYGLRGVQENTEKKITISNVKGIRSILAFNDNPTVVTLAQDGELRFHKIDAVKRVINLERPLVPMFTSYVFKEQLVYWSDRGSRDLGPNEDSHGQRIEATRIGKTLRTNDPGSAIRRLIPKIGLDERSDYVVGRLKIPVSTYGDGTLTVRIGDTYIEKGITTAGAGERFYECDFNTAGTYKITAEFDSKHGYVTTSATIQVRPKGRILIVAVVPQSDNKISEKTVDKASYQVGDVKFHIPTAKLVHDLLSKTFERTVIVTHQTDPAGLSGLMNKLKKKEDIDVVDFQQRTLKKETIILTRDDSICFLFKGHTNFVDTPEFNSDQGIIGIKQLKENLSIAKSIAGRVLNIMDTCHATAFEAAHRETQVSFFPCCLTYETSNNTLFPETLSKLLKDPKRIVPSPDGLVRCSDLLESFRSASAETAKENNFATGYTWAAPILYGNDFAIGNLPPDPARPK